MVPYSNGELAQMERAGRNAERCVCCGAIIPEGRQVCLICELNVKNKCNLVEVVKCKDCVHLVKSDPGHPDCDYCERLICGTVQPDFFCAAGKRRKDNGNP